MQALQLQARRAGSPMTHNTAHMGGTRSGAWVAFPGPMTGEHMMIIFWGDHSYRKGKMEVNFSGDSKELTVGSHRVQILDKGRYIPVFPLQSEC